MRAFVKTFNCGHRVLAKSWRKSSRDECDVCREADKYIRYGLGDILKERGYSSHDVASAACALSTSEGGSGNLERAMYVLLGHDKEALVEIIAMGGKHTPWASALLQGYKKPAMTFRVVQALQWLRSNAYKITGYRTPWAVYKGGKLVLPVSGSVLTCRAEDLEAFRNAFREEFPDMVLEVEEED